MSPAGRFAGRRAVVTGAGGFIGGALSRALAADGARVVGIDIAPPPAQRRRRGRALQRRRDRPIGHRSRPPRRRSRLPRRRAHPRGHANGRVRRPERARDRQRARRRRAHGSANRASELGRRLRLRRPLDAGRGGAAARGRHSLPGHEVRLRSARPPARGGRRPARRRLRAGIDSLDGAAAAARARGPARDPGARRRQDAPGPHRRSGRGDAARRARGPSRPGLCGVERRGRQLQRVLRPPRRAARGPLPAPAPGAALGGSTGERRGGRSARRSARAGPARAHVREPARQRLQRADPRRARLAAGRRPRGRAGRGSRLGRGRLRAHRPGRSTGDPSTKMAPLAGTAQETRRHDHRAEPRRSRRHASGRLGRDPRPGVPRVRERLGELDDLRDRGRADDARGAGGPGGGAPGGSRLPQRGRAGATDARHLRRPEPGRHGPRSRGARPLRRRRHLHRAGPRGRGLVLRRRAAHDPGGRAAVDLALRVPGSRGVPGRLQQRDPLQLLRPRDPGRHADHARGRVDRRAAQLVGPRPRSRGRGRPGRHEHGRLHRRRGRHLRGPLDQVLRAGLPDDAHPGPRRRARGVRELPRGADRRHRRGSRGRRQERSEAGTAPGVELAE